MKHLIKNGFTLVELTVVVAIFGMLFVVVSNTLFNSLKAAMKAEAIKEVRQNGDVAMARMVHDIKNAKSWTCWKDGSPEHNYVLMLFPTDSLTTQLKYRWNAADMDICGSGNPIAKKDTLSRLYQDSSGMIECGIVIDSKSVKLLSTQGNNSVFSCPPDDVNDFYPKKYTTPLTIDFTLEYVPFGNESILSTLRSEERVSMRFHTTVVPRNTN